MNSTLQICQPAATVDDPSALQEMLLTRGIEQASLHEQAEALTRTEFGNQVFVRGVVEISNFCRQNLSLIHI